MEFKRVPDECAGLKISAVSDAHFCNQRLILYIPETISVAAASNTIFDELVLVKKGRQLNPMIGMRYTDAEHQLRAISGVGWRKSDLFLVHFRG